IQARGAPGRELRRADRRAPPTARCRRQSSTMLLSDGVSDMALGISCWRDRVTAGPQIQGCVKRICATARSKCISGRNQPLLENGRNTHAGFPTDLLENTFALLV